MQYFNPTQRLAWQENKAARLRGIRAAAFLIHAETVYDSWCAKNALRTLLDDSDPAIREAARVAARKVGSSASKTLQIYVRANGGTNDKS